MKGKASRKVLTQWDELIQEANRQIATAKERIATLRKTIRSLKQVRDSGQLWPGDKRSA
jgi:hypothetical protein